MTQEGIDLRIHPGNLVRLFAWEVLEANGLMKPLGGRLPIVPLSEEPELKDYSDPYIVYGYAVDASRDLYAHQSGVVSFVVYSNTVSEVNSITNLLNEVFKRGDETARAVNNFTTEKGYIGIRFTTFYVGAIDNPEPRTQEGGRINAAVSISFSYIPTYEINLTPYFD